MLDRSHPNYEAGCEESLDLAARELIEAAIVAGWSPPILFGSLVKVVDSQWLAYAKDPDPSDDSTAKNLVAAPLGR